MSGTLVLKGTRVPVKTMFDYLLTGTHDLPDFTEAFPTINPDDARAVLRMALAVFTNPAEIKRFQHQLVA